MRRFARFGIICAITHEGVLPYLKPATLLKVTLLHGFFLTFFKLYKWYHNHGTHHKWSIKGQAKATTALKMKFSINSSVNVTNSTDSCGFGHIY